MTRWAKQVNPEAPLPDYPRPQLVRKDWVNLNGLWDYAVKPKAEDRPAGWDGKILVPFAIESALSGVGKTVGPDHHLWYQRTANLAKVAGKRWLLHFGAADWQATVWVNGKQVGEHKGGFDPFSFDVTDALKDGAAQEIVVRVWDPTDHAQSYIPRGKQVERPGGIMYTSVTGLWQTVWAEPVPEARITGVQPVAELEKSTVRFHVSTTGGDGLRAKVAIHKDGDPATPVSAVTAGKGTELVATLTDAKPWTPDSPQLYGATITLEKDGAVVDTVETYFALRSIAVGKDADGINRLLLNKKPLFQYGPLDQGWWPDGLYTAPTDEALKYDLVMTKKWGMNMVRKHVKVEPARWYRMCDELGLLVWQDMPSGDRGIRDGAPDLVRTPESAACYEAEWTAIIGALKPFSCIVMWVPFNEGWGQFDTARIVDFTRKLDPTRLVDCASGWTDRPGIGDVHDMHHYPAPAMHPVEEKRASVLGEFGGLGLPTRGHMWVESDKNWGYQSFKTPEELGEKYLSFLRQLRPLISKGLSAAVYTQTTDVEVEANGLMTYDREVEKAPAQAGEVTRKLYEPMPAPKTVLDDSQATAATWSWTTEKPADGWEKEGFATPAWKQGPAGFGTQGTPGGVVRTEWKSTDIWLRREFDAAGPARELALSIHHDEDTEVYLNGVKIADLPGWTTEYSLVPLSATATAALKPGKNLLALHTRQKSGGQYIDAGLLDLAPVGK